MYNLKKSDVKLSERYFKVTKSKTDAGVRTVPIAEKIVPFFEHWLSKDTEYVFTNRQGKQFKDKNFRDSYWQPLMDLLNLPHLPHDTRHTCTSLLAEQDVNDKIIRKIVGHAGKTVTETVYTHYEIQSLIDAINKI
jgi:integrase